MDVKEEAVIKPYFCHSVEETRVETCFECHLWGCWCDWNQWLSCMHFWGDLVMIIVLQSIHSLHTWHLGNFTHQTWPLQISRLHQHHWHEKWGGSDPQLGGGVEPPMPLCLPPWLVSLLLLCLHLLSGISMLLIESNVPLQHSQCGRSKDSPSF